MKAMVDGSGVILLRDERLKKRIQPGEWDVVASEPNLLVLAKSRGQEPARMPMLGEIKAEGWLTGIAELVCGSRLTGRLAVATGEVRRELVFDSGNLRLANSTATGDLLGEFVLSLGLITREQLDEALADLGPGKRLGQVLVDRGLLTRQDVYLILNRKIEKIFMDTIALGEGTYSFSEDIDLSRLPANICVDTRTLLARALEKRDDLRRYLKVERDQAGREDVLKVMVNDFNLAILTIQEWVRTKIWDRELTMLGRDFLERSAKQIRGIDKVVLSESGEVDLASIRDLYETVESKERMNTVVMVLSRYISFLLFTANSYLPQDEQERLSAKIYGKLEKYS